MEAEQWAPASPIQRPAQKELIMEKGGDSYQGRVRVSDTGFFFSFFFGGGLGRLEIIVGESENPRTAPSWTGGPGGGTQLPPSRTGLWQLGRRILQFLFKASKAPRGTKRRKLTHL